MLPSQGHVSDSGRLTSGRLFPFWHLPYRKHIALPATNFSGSTNCPIRIHSRPVVQSLMRYTATETLRRRCHFPKHPKGQWPRLKLDQILIELLQAIAKCLPTASAVSLALRNHVVRAAIGTQYEYALCHRDLWEILTSLQRDLSECFLCHCFLCHCSRRLHHRAKFNPSEFFNPCVRLNGGGVEFVYDRGCNGKPNDIRIFRLGFPHAQLLTSDNHLISAHSYIAGYQPSDLRLIDSPNHVLCFEHERT